MIKCKYSEQYAGNLYKCNYNNNEKVSCPKYLDFGMESFCTKHLCDNGAFEKSIKNKKLYLNEVNNE